MRRRGQQAVGLHAQTFFFDTAAEAVQHLARQRAETFFERHNEYGQHIYSSWINRSSAQATQYFQRSQAQQLHLVGDLHHRLVVGPETLDVVPPRDPKPLRLRRTWSRQDLGEIANIKHPAKSLHRIAELTIFLKVQVFHDDLRFAQILERLERGNAHTVIDFGLLVAPGVIRHPRKGDDHAHDGGDVGSDLRHDLRAIDYDLHLTAST